LYAHIIDSTRKRKTRGRRISVPESKSQRPSKHKKTFPPANHETRVQHEKKKIHEQQQQQQQQQHTPKNKNKTKPNQTKPQQQHQQTNKEKQPFFKTNLGFSES
jgi:hypothetical protein